MKIIVRLLPICIMGLCFASCSRVYTAGVVSNDIYHTEKPFFIGEDERSNKDAIYGSVSFTNNNGFNGDEKNRSLMIQGYKSHAKKWWSTSYGGYFYTGDYEVTLSPSQTRFNFQGENQNYFGFGAKADFFLSINNDFLNFRILGIEASLSKEWGDYQNALEGSSGLNANGDFITFYDPDILFGWGQASEIEFLINDDIKFGTGFAFGGYIDVPIGYFQGRLFGSYKDFSLSFQLTSMITGFYTEVPSNGVSLSVIYRIDYSKPIKPRTITPKF